MDSSSGNSTGIQIRNLFKIFGRSGVDHVEKVQRGMSKTELLERHGHVLGLKDINIDMPAGSIQVIMGLSGSGKSTLIRHINRLIDPTVGQILVEGTDVVTFNPRDLRDFRRHKTAMVFQKFGLLPHRNVLENTVYGLEVQGMPRARQVDAAMRWIERVGLTGFEDRYPNQLSGGMQQRVGLARALANDAPILLMDEAFSALDPLIRADMQSVLLDLQKEIRKTIVFITHDLDEALRLGDGIAILRDGEIVQQGTSQDIVLRPADDYIASFVKEVNRGRVVRVASAMTLLKNGDTGSNVSIAAEATLETAAYTFRENDVDKLTVVDDTNIPVGTISLREVMNAMVTTERLT
ncbi:glycine betaine/L-proline ABC transporter ATP-binding protein [Mesorhizobium sp. SB112]|uniref:quaternary amine ABC transporter ATP-binding protein n=1 Tax=Mesorhizobium sp. SB112 TaxID=3151853 RepID=UPI0032653D9D